MGCGVTERVERNTWKWFGHVERLHDGKFKKENIYMSEVNGNIAGKRHLAFCKEIYWRENTGGCEGDGAR